MTSISARKEHDNFTAILRIHGLIELVEKGYDFSGPNGRAVLDAAKQAVNLLEAKVLNRSADTKRGAH